MTEKTPQEKAAMERLTTLFEQAFEKASKNGGIWLNAEGKKSPAFYQKGVQISPFNAVILGLHSDQNNYKTNLYTLFSEAKKRGESVQTKEKGVPFFWYNWSEYQNKHNPEDKISRNDYQSLPADKQGDYKGIRTREVRFLFNIEQTTLPMVDKASYENAVHEYGGLSNRNVDESDKNLRTSVDELINKVSENMVEIRKDDSFGMAFYDSRNDIVRLPGIGDYSDYSDYVRDAVANIVEATGHPQRLARDGMLMEKARKPSEDAQKQNRLVVEIASAIKAQELGIPAKLSSSSMEMTDYWIREMKENPCLFDAVEREVNQALAMIKNAENGEKVELKSVQSGKEGSNILPKHYYVADEIKGLPNKDTKEFVVVRDPVSLMADVVLPAGASHSVDNEIPGMNKNRIEHALQKEGYETVTFYNVNGSFGYRPDDHFFDGKEVSVARMNKWNLEDLTKLDVTDAVRRSNAIDFDRILMLKDDEGKWALYLKPENEKAFSVYPDKADVNHFFTTLKQGNEEQSDQIRGELAQKYYALAADKPEIKVDLFKSNASAGEIAKIERVNIFKTKATEKNPSVILCLPTINGVKQKPREVSPQQWFRLWLADDMKDYKTHLAASLFADVLRKDQSNSVAVGTSMSEQEAQTETKETQHTDLHEDNEKHKRNEEQASDNNRQHEEKSRADAARQETKPASNAVDSPILRQFYDLKSKHPDALLLFRTGDFYETYGQDAEKSSRILGITLTKSTKTKDKEGKPLTMAGFPYHALDSYLPKLIRAGERVAICDQIEAPRRSGNQNDNANDGARTEQQQKQIKQDSQQMGFHR